MFLFYRRNSGFVVVGSDEEMATISENTHFIPFLSENDTYGVAFIFRDGREIIPIKGDI
jgi:hypothetical protein